MIDVHNRIREPLLFSPLLKFYW